MTDGRTDRRTDRRTEFSSLDRVCIACSAVKIEKKLSMEKAIGIEITNNRKEQDSKVSHTRNFVCTLRRFVWLTHCGHGRQLLPAALQYVSVHSTCHEADQYLNRRGWRNAIFKSSNFFLSYGRLHKMLEHKLKQF